jgi:hypothetical protein
MPGTRPGHDKSKQSAPWCWSNADIETVKRMIAESDAEGGDIPFEEDVRSLTDKSA